MVSKWFVSGHNFSCAEKIYLIWALAAAAVATALIANCSRFRRIGPGCGQHRDGHRFGDVHAGAALWTIDGCGVLNH